MLGIVVCDVYSVIYTDGLDRASESVLKDILQDTAAFQQKGAEFSPKYQAGQWDGMVRLYKRDRSGRYFVPTGLIMRVCSELHAYKMQNPEFDFRVRYDRKVPTQFLSDGHMAGIEFRPHQLAMIETIKRGGKGRYLLSEDEAEKLQSGVGQDIPIRLDGMGIWWSATGSGKTIASGGLIADLGVQALFVVYGADLVVQTHKVFEKHLGAWLREHGHHVGCCVEGDLDFGYVTVASASTLVSAINPKSNKGVVTKALKKIGNSLMRLDSVGQTQARQVLSEIQKNWTGRNINRLWSALNVLERLFDEMHPKEIASLERAINRLQESEAKKKEVLDYLETVDLLIFDEAHGVAAKGHYELAMKCPAYYRVAMSGTPLGRTSGDNLKIVGAFGDPVARVTNAEMVEQGFIPQARIEMWNVKGTLGNYRWPRCYDEGIIFHGERNARIVEAVVENQGKAVMCIYKSIAHGEILQELLGIAGLSVSNISGESPLYERQEAVDDLVSGNIQVLLASGIFTQGVDIPDVDVLVNVAGGKAPVQVLQRLGRGLRGEGLLLIDFSDGHHKLLSKHSKARRALYEQQNCFEITDRR